jgi:hypothetical protein
VIRVTWTARAATTLVAAPAQRSLLRITFAATLTRTSDGAPVAVRTIAFSVAGHTLCQATTNASGVATCSITALTIIIGRATYTAAFAGDTAYLASSATGQL